MDFQDMSNVFMCTVDRNLVPSLPAFARFNYILGVCCIEEWQQSGRRSLTTPLLLETEHLTSSVCQNLDWTHSRARTHIHAHTSTKREELIYASYSDSGLLGQPVWVCNQFTAFYFAAETDCCRNTASGEAIAIISIMTMTTVMENKLKRKT